MVSIVTSFATLVTVHVAIAAGFLTRGRPWWHAPFALVLLPLAPYWGFQDGMRHCAATHGLQQFDGHRGRYVDDVRSWQTDEPALDMTGAAIIAAAAQLHLHDHAQLRSPGGTR